MFQIGQYDLTSQLNADFIQIQRYSKSNEYLAADALINAYEKRDEEEFSKVVKLNVFKYLLNSISQLVRKLQIDGKKWDEEDENEERINSYCIDENGDPILV